MMDNPDIVEANMRIVWMAIAQAQTNSTGQIENPGYQRDCFQALR
jgi:hypothetical protein